VNRLLARAIACNHCGKDAEATQAALELVEILEMAGILPPCVRERP
jgi:hypothetical protein